MSIDLWTLSADNLSKGPAACWKQKEELPASKEELPALKKELPALKKELPASRNHAKKKEALQIRRLKIRID